MRIRDCIKNEKLLKEFDKQVKSGKDEFQAARDILLSQHKLLHERMNEIRKKLQVKEVKYEP